MKLDEAKLRQYEHDGYTTVDGLISTAKAAAVRNRLLELMEGRHDWPDLHFQVLDPGRFRNKEGGFVPVGVQRPARQEAVFREIADHDNLQGAMSQLLAGPVKRFTDQALIKHRKIDGHSFYHQDSYYWKIEPGRGCNAWIALDEVGVDASALGILPGTHRDWTLTTHERYFDEPNYYAARTVEAFSRWRIPTDGLDLSGEVVLPMQPGDAAFFSNYTWHRSEVNRSGEHKTAYAIAYQLR
ncbi:MAG: phytanoyl-CoA dioxygenase family protein [Gemmatimonadota bacterium]|nr:phytanoyl-CoA dioxygenase family protein [Gemmatimonadota bacterium]